MHWQTGTWMLCQLTHHTLSELAKRTDTKRTNIRAHRQQSVGFANSRARGVLSWQSRH
jgi:hypothetical protein